MAEKKLTKPADALPFTNLFELGNSIVVDPVTRKVVSIDGVPVTEHTEAMQAFAERALTEAGVAP